MANTRADQRLQKRLKKKQAKEQQRLQREQRLQSQSSAAAPKPKEQPQPLLAKTEGQLALIRAIKANPQVVVVGPAGTGKSFIPATLAADWLREGKIKKIVLCRPTVSVGRTMGFLPGDQHEKIMPWMIPLIEPLNARLGKSFVEHAIKTGKIEIAPLETMRGRTFRDAFVILDEAQNCDLEELKMLVTRIGEETQLVIDGDIAQADRKDSGLSQLIRIAEKYDIGCEPVTLTLDDVVRSGITKQWLLAFHEENL